MKRYRKQDRQEQQTTRGGGHHEGMSQAPWGQLFGRRGKIGRNEGAKGDTG